MFLSKDYFIPTEESLLWLEGWTEFPATVVDTSVFDVEGADVTTGLEIGGRWKVMLPRGLGTELAKSIAALLTGKDWGIGLDEEADTPCRAAIICARSW